MDIETLKNFVQLSRYGNYARAARESFISPQGLWRSMRALEKELDTALILKTEEGLVFTKEGQRFLQFAKNVLREYESMSLDLDRLSREGRNRIRIRFVIGFFGFLSPDLFARFREDYPQLQLDYSQLPDKQVDEALRRGDCDLAVTRYPYVEEDFHTDPLLTVPLHVWVSTKNPLSKKGSLSLSDLRGQPIVSVSPDYKSSLRLKAACEEAGFSPSFPLITDERASALQAVYNDQGVSPALPYERVLLQPELARSIPLSDFQDSFGISYKKDRQLSEAEKLFIARLKKDLERN